MRMLWVSSLAWMIGMMAYETWLRVVWRHGMGGDWQAVAFSSALAFAVSAPLVYMPAMILVRWILRGYKPIIWFPLVAAVLGVIPTAIIMFSWGGRLGSLLSAEASIFYVMFAASGVVFGFGYALRRRVAT